jgi:threonine dehydratase
MSPAEGIGPREVDTAARRIAAILPATPTVRSDRFDAWFKLENLQVTGSYKVRGALNALLLGARRSDRRPVIAASAGNHAQGLAWAARHLGIAAYTVVPTGASITKVQGATHLGAQVIAFGECYEDAERHARELASAHGWRFLSAFDDAEVIAGQGSVGVELAPLAPDVVLVPVGGGGLAAGIGLALRSSQTRVVGVQVRGVQGMAAALAGATEFPEPAATIADGVRVRRPGTLTRDICARVLDDIVVVSEEEVRATMVALALEARIIAEGAGALAVAALGYVSGRHKLAIVSGGNIDAAVLSALLNGKASAA